MQNKKNGFTVLEMMIVMLVIALLLLITLPNIQQKETIIRDKGCQALLDIVDSQIILYEIDNDENFGFAHRGDNRVRTCFVRNAPFGRRWRRQRKHEFAEVFRARR